MLLRIENGVKKKKGETTMEAKSRKGNALRFLNFIADGRRPHTGTCMPHCASSHSSHPIDSMAPHETGMCGLSTSRTKKKTQSKCVENTPAPRRWAKTTTTTTRANKLRNGETKCTLVSERLSRRDFNSHNDPTTQQHSVHKTRGGRSTDYSM